MNPTGALKARVPRKPVPSLPAANPIPVTTPAEIGSERPDILEDAGYMVAGG